MSTRSFAFFILLMLFGIQGVFLTFQNQLNGKQELEFKLAKLQTELDREKAKTEIAYYELESFKQKVAINLPSHIPQQAYSVRNIASIVTETKPLDLKSKLEFSEIKKLYLGNNFTKAALELKEYTSMFPESPFVLEANYLLVMSYYKSSQYDNAIQAVDVLVEQFPDSEMTGLSLLVMGDIMKKKERYVEAKQIFSTVKKNFPYPELQKQAEAKIEEIKL
jgi:TolA-binding protein